MYNDPPIKQITDLSIHLPRIVLEDVNKRITDWLAAGGNEHDPYIYQQLRYVERVVKTLRY